MTRNITLNVSKNVIRDGECVDVSWKSNVPESIFLTIEDGYGTTRIDIPDSGSRKCWSNHAKKNLVITLTAIQVGKKEVISIFGSNDGVLNMKKYNEYRKNLPEDFIETVIEGGNHGYFAIYGHQDGDATISRSEQIRQTASAISRLLD